MPNLKKRGKISNPIKVSIRRFDSFCFYETGLGFNDI